MSVRKIEQLSIWEIGHRWEGVDPDEAEARLPPPRVRERLRELIHLSTYGLNCYDIHGDLVELEKLWFGFPKNKLAKRLDVAKHDPASHKELLQSLFLDQMEMWEWCRGSGWELPDFWFEPNEVEEQRRFIRGGTAEVPGVPKRRPDQEDRARCQEIARKLWKDHPTMTIAAMARRREIQIDGNGKAYKGKNTLRNWLKEAAPDSVRNRPGRPRKSESPGEES